MCFQDLKRSWKVAEELEYGMIGVNEVGITSEVAPFGGIKHSGIGREHSKYGMDEFLYIKCAAYLHPPTMHHTNPNTVCERPGLCALSHVYLVCGCYSTESKYEVLAREASL